jgi:hypothetical protein
VAPFRNFVFVMVHGRPTTDDVDNVPKQFGLSIGTWQIHYPN